jgi:hypothetical protein
MDDIKGNEHDQDVHELEIELTHLVEHRPAATHPTLPVEHIDHFGPPKPRSSFSKEYIWRSCCCTSVDRRYLLFVSQATISMSTLSFCLYKLATTDKCETEQLYSAMLFGVMGFWMPNPKLK